MNGQHWGFRLDPSAASGRTLQLDWVRLTSEDTSNIVAINWSGVSSGSKLYFYLNSSSCSTSGSTLVGIQSRGSANSGTFSWGSSLQNNPFGTWTTGLAQPLPLPESFQPGQYYVYMLVDNAGSPICAPSPLTIDKAPILNFQKPSMYSGNDYATQVVGDAWDMSNTQDIASTTNVATSQWGGGIYTGTSTSGDPMLWLHLTSPIDSSKYRYATFRYWLEGIQNIGGGWITRFIWYTQGAGTDDVTLRDTIIYEGWNTYSIDLQNAPIEDTSHGPPWGSTFPTVFRFDQNENTTGNPWTFHLDFVTLTADETIKRGTPFPIYYVPTPSSGVTVNFHYSPTPNPSNCAAQPQASRYVPSSRPYAAFIPLVLRNSAGMAKPSEINLLTGTQWLWDTSAVTPGTYYICGIISDGVMSTSWNTDLPDIPVTVTP
jgi:hypothetical protein